MNHIMSLSHMVFLSLFGAGIAFHYGSFGLRSYSQKVVRMSTAEMLDIKYESVAVSGFVSKENGFADTSILSRLFLSGSYDTITAITDDISFAKKRVVNPKTVYSGLIDVLEIVESSSVDSLEKTLTGKDAWVCFNVSSSDLDSYAAAAANAGLKRAVFAVCVTPEQQGEDVTFENACAILSKKSVQFTIIKFAGVSNIPEATKPYRIVRGLLPIPSEDNGYMALKDLTVILAESVDLAKTFDTVYGIGAGSNLDTEILVYMKSQGWPERIQVGLLMGDLMENIESRFKAEQEKKTSSENLPSAVKASPLSAPLPYAGNKLSGFFSG